MHTTGEPTRIVISGFPHLPGPSLLLQRAQAKSEHDNVRRRLMLEPRGHYDMYGAILCQNTELLLDVFLSIRMTKVFPRRDELTFDPDQKVTKVNLHAPCGLVKVTVPANETDTLDENGNKLTVADPTRPVSFISTPAFASGINVKVTIPKEKIWPELAEQGRNSVTLDVSFGGTYYAMIDVKELGFATGGLKKGEMNFDAISRAVKILKSHLVADQEFKQYITHPTIPDYSFLYSIMVVDEIVGLARPGVDGAETGLSFFTDHEIDRSPTGGCVTARMALAHEKGLRKIGQRWTYHSVVSIAFNGVGGFTASIVEELDIPGIGNKTVAKGVRVRVEANAYYTGSSSFICEDGDVTSKGGFTLQSVTQA